MILNKYNYIFLIYFSLLFLVVYILEKLFIISKSIII